jgi:curved DNA-binding protein
MADNKDYYKTLGVERTATDEEIKKAFRKLAQKHHPDAGGDEETFKDINEAYAVLSDPEKRKQYDRFGSSGFSDVFNNAQGAWGNYWSQGTSGTGAGVNFNFSDLFDGLKNGEGVFGARQRANARKPKKGRDLKVNLDVTFEEAYSGATKRVTVNIPNSDEKETINVKVPAGAVDGGKLRYKGKGLFGTNGGNRGDLLVVTKILPDKRFARKGADVLTTAHIPMVEAALGTTLDVPVPDGSSVCIKVPAGTQTGTVFSIKDKGAPRVNGEGRGAIKVTVNVDTPTNLTAKQRDLLKQFVQEG